MKTESYYDIEQLQVGGFRGDETFPIGGFHSSSSPSIAGISLTKCQKMNSRCVLPIDETKFQDSP